MFILQYNSEKKQVKPETMETNVLGSHPGKGPLLSRRALADAERDRALQLARAFKPTGPSFLSPISKYNTRRRDYLVISALGASLNWSLVIFASEISIVAGYYNCSFVPIDQSLCTQIQMYIFS